MATKEIVYQGGKPYAYQHYTIMPFSNWRAMIEFANKIKKVKPSAKVTSNESSFKSFVNRDLISNSKKYGLFGKQPKSYDEAIKRENFIYYDEYKRIKRNVEEKIAKELQKSSLVDIMKPRLVFNDKGIGEFVFSKAAMSLKPNIYKYSPSKKREIDSKEEIVYEGKRMYLKSDKSIVINALKVTKKGGSVEYVELKSGNEGEKSLQEARKIGIISCSSANKKVYLYKEKKPKMFNAVKIVVGLTMGGLTAWDNDFYTGIAAVVIVDVLESLGYSVDIEVVLGGGRCDGSICGPKPLNFSNYRGKGRRFFTFTAKSFDEQLDLDGLLYTLCDPSFVNIKFVSILNNFFNLHGDYITDGNPIEAWHGLEETDLVNPIGAFIKGLDKKNGNDNIIHFYMHRVTDEADVVRQLTDLVLTCENKNKLALEKYATHDYGLDK
jgi:hypothetical protein